MITIKNTDTQALYWFALPKFSIDISKALAHGPIAAQSETKCDPKTTVNLMFTETNKKNVVSMCMAADDATVVFYNPRFGPWCHTC